MSRDRRTIGTVLALIALVGAAAVLADKEETVGGGEALKAGLGQNKKQDSAKAAITNVRALILDMRTQVGALGRLTTTSSGDTGAIVVSETEEGYAAERNGRLNDLRQKARLLETETNQLQTRLEGQSGADVIKLGREIHKESRSLQTTIERFPREPDASVDDVLVGELRSQVAKLEEHSRTMVMSYRKPN